MLPRIFELAARLVTTDEPFGATYRVATGLTGDWDPVWARPQVCNRRATEIASMLDQPERRALISVERGREAKMEEYLHDIEACRPTKPVIRCVLDCTGNLYQLEVQLERSGMTVIRIPNPPIRLLLQQFSAAIKRHGGNECSLAECESEGKPLGEIFRQETTHQVNQCGRVVAQILSA